MRKYKGQCRHLPQPKDGEKGWLLDPEAESPVLYKDCQGRGAGTLSQGMHPAHSDPEGDSQENKCSNSSPCLQSPTVGVGAGGGLSSQSLRAWELMGSPCWCGVPMDQPAGVWRRAGGRDRARRAKAGE